MDLWCEILGFAKPKPRQLQRWRLVSRSWNLVLSENDLIWKRVFGSNWTRGILCTWTGFATWLWTTTAADHIKNFWCEKTKDTLSRASTSRLTKCWIGEEAKLEVFLIQSGPSSPKHFVLDHLLFQWTHFDDWISQNPLSSIRRTAFSLAHLWRLCFTGPLSLQSEFRVRLQWLISDHQLKIYLTCDAYPDQEVQLSLEDMMGRHRFRSIPGPWFRISATEDQMENWNCGVRNATLFNPTLLGVRDGRGIPARPDGRKRSQVLDCTPSVPCLVDLFPRSMDSAITPLFLGGNVMFELERSPSPSTESVVPLQFLDHHIRAFHQEVRLVVALSAPFADAGNSTLFLVTSRHLAVARDNLLTFRLIRVASSSDQTENSEIVFQATNLCQDGEARNLEVVPLWINKRTLMIVVYSSNSDLFGSQLLTIPRK